MKRCSACGKDKPLFCFGHDRRLKGKLKARCRLCSSKEMRRQVAVLRAVIGGKGGRPWEWPGGRCGRTN
jgi:hypothetical protein